MTPPGPTASTFYRRPLPEGLVPFASAEGRRLFQEALATGGMEGWFALAEQFHTQSDPAFCGLGSLVVVLNALEIDPGRIWKGPWRWYAEELLDCCLPLEEVRTKGVTLDELCCLAACNGAHAKPRHAEEAGVEELREAIRVSAAAPRGPVVIAAYSRRILGQTGEGHFSPVAGYHAGRDLALVLDVARFKYPPHWIPVALLHEAMRAPDPVSGRSRGWASLTRNELPSALLFRLAASEDAQRLSTALFERLATRTATSETPEAWVKALDAEVGEGLAGWMARAIEGPVRMRDEHRNAVQALRAELCDTAAYALVRRARGAEGAPGYRDEALAVLVLALPETLLTFLHAPAGLEDHRAIAPASGALAAEVSALREQLQTLQVWRERNRPACKTGRC